MTSDFATPNPRNLHDPRSTTHDPRSSCPDPRSVPQAPAGTYAFPHERLDAWRVARQFYLQCSQLQGLPRASGHAGDQLERAALSVVLNIVEGAGRSSWKEKRHFFSIALGSLAESTAVLDLAAAKGLLDPTTTTPIQTTARRVGAMLTGLMKAGGG